MPYTTVYREVEIDIDLDDFDNDELIEELERRGYSVFGKEEENTISRLYSTYLTSSSETFEKELKAYFRNTLGVNIY